MALRPPSSGKHSSAPHYLPATPLQNNDTSINVHNKRLRLVQEENTGYLDIGSLGSSSDGAFAVDAQIQHNQVQQQSDWEQLGLQLHLQPQFPQPEQYDDSLADENKLLSSFAHDLPQGDEQFATTFLAFDQLHQQQPEQMPTSPTLQHDFSSAVFYNPLGTHPDIPSPRGAFQYPAHETYLPPPPPAHTVLAPQQVLLQEPVYTEKPCPRPAMTSTTAVAAAALSKSSSEATSAYVSAIASATSASAAQALRQRPPSLGMLRIGGYTLSEAGIQLPDDLCPEEVTRRLCLLAEELHYESTHPPVLPPSQVADLPEKPPPPVLPRVQPGMTQAQRDAIAQEVLRVSVAQRKADQERNNLAAKKSRLLRLECLDNTRLQLNAKSAECAWLRLQMVALSGKPLARRPSEAWGGSDFVYQPREEDDVEGVVPTRVKVAITEEVRARVEAHREAVDEEHKRKTNASRTQRRSEAQAKAQADMDANPEDGCRRRASNCSRM
ncbi:hypothetical protein A9K55_005964 [Cordyceps militaris]|uniref:BZIP domain-containing protein n=1 Tax=Cordyceps militaris TaxID=73501 RepID=A0A2H4SAW3_CORMI|nr:hypothetical protein A9K55_005964 [Cordyceps militaris]